MARTTAELPRRPLPGRPPGSVRQRDLPAHVVVYYVIALALYMQSSYREVLALLAGGMHWLLDPSATVKVAGKSGISQARTRLGWEPVRQLHDEVVKPDRDPSDPRSLVSALAIGQPGRQHAGCCRRGGQ